MYNDAHSTPSLAELLQRAEAIVNRSTAHARTEWERTHCIDWVMSLLDEEGYPTASMITASRSDGFKWITFCTGAGWNKPNRIARDARTCIYFFDEPSFTGISLTGKTEVLTDDATKTHMWYDELGASFTGPRDPNWCVLRFVPERYSIFINDHTIRGKF